MIQSIIQVESGAENANQTFSVNLGGTLYNMDLQYKYFCQCWHLTVSTKEKRIITGVRLLKRGNLLEPFFNLDKEFGGLVVIGEEPTLDNLGVSSQIVWYKE